jgi:proton-dependent oligopeptide transporter, POT family
MEHTTEQKGHPRGLYLLFFTEMWERFSYYGMRAIFILFLTKAILLNSQQASNIYGSFTGLVYLTPLLGGYLSDRYWGNRKSILIGGLLMAVGQFLLFFSGSSLGTGTEMILMLTGITFLIMGNGFFKPNISTMVGQLYVPGDKRVDAAFTIFYMGINMGAFFSPLICGSLGDTGDMHDFKWGFFAAGIGMLLSVLSFELLKNKHIVSSTGEPLGLPKAKMPVSMLFTIIGITALMFLLFRFKDLIGFDFIGLLIYGSMVAMPIIILSDKSLLPDERQRIIVIFILAFFVVFFWACFEQAGASLTLFADQQVNRQIHIFVPAWLILAVILVITFFLGKGLAWFFEWTKKLQYTVVGVLSVIFLTLYFGGFITDFTKEEFPASWFQSVNPLGVIIMAPLFGTMWLGLGKRGLEPPSPLKMALGLMLVSIGYMIIAYGVYGITQQTKISMIFLFALYIVHTMGELCLSPIGLSMVSKLAPLRLSSLLMGTWFLANAAANKFAGTLSALIPPGAGEEASTSIPTFFGIQIDNLFTFFMVFIFLSGIASFILFFLYRFLVRMMHGVS